MVELGLSRSLLDALGDGDLDPGETLGEGDLGGDSGSESEYDELWGWIGDAVP